MYAALIQGRLHEIRDDIPFVKNGMSLTPGSPEYIAFRASLGYLPYVPATPPETETDYHYEAAYAIVDGALVQSWNKEPLTMTYAKFTATGTLAYPPAFSTISKLFATSRYRTISSILFNNTSNRHHKDYPYS